jgi:hypothetical protein
MFRGAIYAIARSADSANERLKDRSMTFQRFYTSAVQGILPFAVAASVGCAGKPQYFTTKLSSAQMAIARATGVAGLLQDDSPKSTDEPDIDQQPPSATCELSLQLKTFDQVLRSRPVCIKDVGKPYVTISEKIALFKNDKIKVDASRYCVEDNAEEIKAEQGLPRVCIWNREIVDRFPFSFVLRTTDNTPLSEHASLVRLLRNGRTIFSWKATQPLTQPNQLIIQAATISQAEYFKEPVDLGLYVLPSGVEAAAAAAANEFHLRQSDFGSGIASALSAAVDSNLPAALHQNVACFKDRLAYAAAVVQGNDPEATRLAAEMADLDGKFAPMKVAVSKATPVFVVTDLPFDEAKATDIIDGVSLDAGRRVLFLTRSEGKLRTFVKVGAPWQSPSNAEWDRTAYFGDSKDRIVRIEAGLAGKGLLFRLANWDNGKKGGLIERLPSSVYGCPSPSKAAALANGALLREVDRAVKKGLTSTPGAVASQARLLSAQLTHDVTSARRGLNEAIGTLPESVQAEVKRDLAWTLAVDDATAQALEATRAIATLGPQIETTIKGVLYDPDAQVRARNAFAATLANDDTLYSARTPNPEAASPEAQLRMTFHRPLQHYYVLAWNGIPFPIAQDAHIEVEPRAENLIPIIDALGLLWQTRNGFVKTIGIGTGVIGTREQVETTPTRMAHTSAFHLGLQANVSLNFLRLGLAYMIKEADDCERRCFTDSKNFRLLLGADIIRLITGKDAAAQKSSASQDTETNSNPKTN